LTTLAWLAIEAAGPDPYRHPVLEAALVLTDWDLNEITTLGMMVKPDRQRFRDWKADMPAEYTRRHTKNRLTSEVGMFGLTLMEVESALVDTFKARGRRDGPGLSVSAAVQLHPTGVSLYALHYAAARQRWAELNPERAVELANGVHAHKGFSVSTTDERLPARGYMVAVRGYEEYHDLASFTPGTLLAYAHRYVEVLDQPDRYLGGWVIGETGELCLDASDYFAAEHAAIAAGFDRAQVAIWDLAAGDEILMANCDRVLAEPLAGDFAKAAAMEHRRGTRFFHTFDRATDLGAVHAFIASLGE
jgi:hypothetical protein